MIILAVLLFLRLTVFLISRIRYQRDRAFLEAQGNCNPVSAGEYAVNLLAYGNENGRHRIVAMAGYGIPDSCITMRRMTAATETENQVVFVDRTGYRISDGTGNLLLRQFLPPKDWLSEPEQRAEYAMALMTCDSRALVSESAKDYRNGRISQGE